MQLQFNRSNGQFILRVPRQGGLDIVQIMRDHGLDMSITASSFSEAVLFTPQPYAAVAFWDHATPDAREQLSWIRQAIDKSWATDHGGHFRMPPDCELWPFQKAGVAYALERQHALIADQPGLGKTNQAIVVANELKAGCVVVVCPASIRLQWIARIRQWTTMTWPYVLHPILSARDGVHPRANWTVLSYELAANPVIRRQLLERRIDLLVIDEAHYLKEPTSRRTKAILGEPDDDVPCLLAGSEKVLALTGTPLPNRPREAFTLAKALCHDAVDWMTHNAFCERFNPSTTVRNKQGQVIRVDERSGRQAELQARLRAHFMVRREKHGPRGVMGQLHMPIYDVIQMEKTGPVKQALAAESLLDIDFDDLSGITADIMGHIAVARRMMGLALAPQIADYVDMLVLGGEDKIVLFAWHIEVLDIFQQRFEKHGVIRIDGRTPANHKQKLIDRFVDEPGVRICIGNMMAMGVGTDGLQKVCNHCLIAEPDWVPGNNVQAVDRLDRGGQHRQVQADIFVAPGSIAEKILESALRKGRVVHQALDAR